MGSPRSPGYRRPGGWSRSGRRRGRRGGRPFPDSTAPVGSPQAEAPILAAQREAAERIAPFSGARDTILTFDEQRPMRDAFAPATTDRLEAIAAARDPDGLFVANHVAD